MTSVLTREALAERLRRYVNNRQPFTDASRLMIEAADALESLPPVEPTEAMVEAALDAYWIAAGVYKAEEMTPDKRSWPERERSHMRAALKAAFALTTPQEHNGSKTDRT